VERSLK